MINLISEKLTLIKPFSTFNINVIYFSVKVLCTGLGSLNVHVHILVSLRLRVLCCYGTLISNSNWTEWSAI